MPFSFGVDVLEPAFQDRPIPYIAYGGHFAPLTASHIINTIQAKRVYIICSTSLAKNKTYPALERLTGAIKHAGGEVVGTYTGFKPHTHWDQVVECAEDASKKDVGCIVTLGAGSLTDAAKVVCWMLANGVTTSEGLQGMRSDNPEKRADLVKAKVRQVAVPTSLSGGEYQSIAGVTLDDGSDRKVLFEPPVYNPSLVVLDPELTTTTPDSIWLSTGVRAVDHCVETLCSLLSNKGADESASEGLRRLVPGLLRCKKDKKDIEARFECMMGVRDAMSAVGSGVPMGGSHAIGHQLGPLGVGHGETSCVMLPAVCMWNMKQGVNSERQRACRDVLMEDKVTRAAVEKRFGAKSGQAELGDVLDVVVRELGMPRTLKDVGVGREKMNSLAKNALQDHWIKTNPKPIDSEGQVMEILEMVVE